MDGYIITEPLNNGVAVVQFPEFSGFPELVHAYSTRKGGVSEGRFATMNFMFGTGDTDDNVRENYRRFFEALGIPEGSEVFTHQTHTNNVRVVTAEDRGTGLMRDTPYRDVDGLVTDVPGLALTTFSSDCVPVYLYDPVRKAIGACLLFDEAERLQIEVTEAELDARIAQYEEQCGGKEAFLALLKKQNINPVEFREQTRRGRRVDKLVEMHTSGVPDPTEEVMREHFEEHRDEYTKGAQAQAQHILVTPKGGGEDAKAEALSKILDL